MHVESKRSLAFERLHPAVQRWVWEQNWTELRDAQEAAAEPILSGHTDVIIAAATASGKTEAAFLPICSRLAWEAEDGAAGFRVLYLSPLKALINDQYARLEALCEWLDIPVHRWHGDVAGSRKARALRDPRGVLLITPESLEALFVNQGPRVPAVLAPLSYIVIDELHSYIGTERGAQLQSLLRRVDLALRREPPRIGLSATLGDMSAAAWFLRPASPSQVRLIESADDGQELRLQIRGYIATPPRLSQREAEAAEKAGVPVHVEDVTTGDKLAMSEHLFTTLRGTDNLVFANSRNYVELFADLLTRLSAQHHVPNEFWAHHGSLSKDLREHVEERLRERARPVNVVCTSTLEMGLDIGTMTSIAQIGPPPGVATLRQRLGRSGRRGGPAVLRVYVGEEELDERTPPTAALRPELVRSVATVQLLLDRWYEPPVPGDLHLSTLVQQVLSTIAQHGGVRPEEAYRALCGPGPFAGVTPTLFAVLLRAMAAHDLISQASD
ncbi:MAG: DEAD/DEAH box helicase, partial [Chloroflexota bacterium]|nr:DEAD/DEAH box helicase [Chloroflexota bacterium]